MVTYTEYEHVAGQESDPGSGPTTGRNSVSETAGFPIINLLKDTVRGIYRQD